MRNSHSRSRGLLLRVYLSPVIRPDCSPGPVHQVDPAFTRRGREGGPAYSIYARHKVRQLCDQSDLSERLRLIAGADQLQDAGPGSLQAGEERELLPGGEEDASLQHGRPQPLPQE